MALEGGIPTALGAQQILERDNVAVLKSVRTGELVE